MRNEHAKRAYRAVMGCVDGRIKAEAVHLYPAEKALIEDLRLLVAMDARNAVDAFRKVLSGRRA